MDVNNAFIQRSWTLSNDLISINSMRCHNLFYGIDVCVQLPYGTTNTISCDSPRRYDYIFTLGDFRIYPHCHLFHSNDTRTYDDVRHEDFSVQTEPRLPRLAILFRPGADTFPLFSDPLHSDAVLS